MIYIEILEICAVVVLVVDMSGIIESLRSVVGKWLHAPADRVMLKPLDCSKCMTFWVGLIYTLIVGELSLTILLYLLLVAMNATNVGMFLSIIIEAIRKGLDQILQKLC